MSSPSQIRGRITGKLGASDLDGDAVTIAKAVATKKATVRVNADGSFTYTPTAAARQAASAPGASSSAKTDTITFTISDGHGGTATLKLKVDIAPASVGNHIPAPGGKYTTTTDSSSGVVTGQVTATDSDGGDALTYRIDEVVDSALGTVVLNPATGVFAFTPSAQARYEAALGVGPRAAQFTITPFDGKDGAPVDVSVVIVPRHPDDDGSVSLVDLEDLVGAGLVQVGENEDGSVRYIDGAFSDDAVRSIADAAAVLNKVAELLGAPAGSVRAEQIIRQAVMDTRGEVAETFYRVSPTVNAIPVLGAQSVLVVDRDGGRHKSAIRLRSATQQC